MKLLILGPSLTIGDLANERRHRGFAIAQQRPAFPDLNREVDEEWLATAHDMMQGWLAQASLIQRLCDALGTDAHETIRIDYAFEVVHLETQMVDAASFVVTVMTGPQAGASTSFPDGSTNRVKRWLMWERFPLASWLATRTEERPEHPRPPEVDRVLTLRDDCVEGQIQDFIFLMFLYHTPSLSSIMDRAPDEVIAEIHTGSKDLPS